MQVDQVRILVQKIDMEVELDQREERKEMNEVAEYEEVYQQYLSYV